MEQFARRGFRGTRVEDIEVAVGLVPRRGGFYRHFDSKEALFVAVVERYSEDVTGVGLSVDSLDVSDVRATLEFVVRATLDVLDQQRALLRILQRDLDQLPVGLSEVVHEKLVANGYTFADRLISRMLASAGRPVVGSTGLAAVALGAIVHFREDVAVYGIAPAGANEEEFVTAWVELMTAALSPPAHAKRPSQPNPRR